MNISEQHTASPFYPEGDDNIVTGHSEFNTQRARGEVKHIT
jgi:hypothetical protein